MLRGMALEEFINNNLLIYTTSRNMIDYVALTDLQVLSDKLTFKPQKFEIERGNITYVIVTNKHEHCAVPYQILVYERNNSENKDYVALKEFKLEGDELQQFIE